MATGHGNTPAAWTSVTIMFVGFVIGAVAVVLANIPLLIGGGVVIVLGALTGKVMAMLGYGAPTTPRPPAATGPQEQPSSTPAPTAGDAGQAAATEAAARAQAPVHHPAGSSGPTR